MSAASKSEVTKEHEPAALPAPEVQKALPASALPKPAGSGFGWRKIVLVLILLAAAAFTWWRLHNNNTEKVAETDRTAAMANHATPVTVAPVASRTMPIFYTALGTVEAYNAVTIKSRVDGQLLSVNVREGQQVRTGQVIAMIDPRPYQATVAQAQGQLAKDTAAAKNTDAEANRYKALYQAGVVSAESEQAQISSAGQSVGTLEADRAAIQAARVNLGYTRIVSPINGVVGLRQVDAGNIVHASDAGGLLLVTQLQPISVIFTLPEDQLQPVLQRMRAGAKLSVEAYDRSQTTRIATGTLLTVDNQIDTTTGTLKGKAVFPNADKALFPNQFVNVRVILEERANSLVIPAAALQSGSQGTFVYIVKPCPESGCPEPEGAHAGGAGPGGGGKGPKPSGAPAPGAPDQPRGPQSYVEMQPVVVDLTEGSQIILKSGVRPGDLVVIDGEEKLKPRSKVIPKQGRPTSAGGPGTQAVGARGASAGVPAASDAGAAAGSPSSPDQQRPGPAHPRAGSHP